MQKILRDLRYALRMLARKPVFTAGAVLSISLGIGANVAIFTCINALLLNPLPVEDPSSLAFVYTTDTNQKGLFGTSYENYVDYLDNDVFSELTVFRPLMFELSSAEQTELVRGEMVSGNYFDALGVGTSLGRTFRPEEDSIPGAHPVVVLSHHIWQRRYGGDSDIVGKTIKLNNRSFTVIGVTEEGFRGVYILANTELWVPNMMYQTALSGILLDAWDKRELLMLNMGGRLKPGVSTERADAAMKAIAQNLETQYPKENEGKSLQVVPMVKGVIVPELRDVYVLGGQALLALGGLLLLIATANVANLLLARALERRKEIAIRLSQGAGQRDLLRQLMVEGLLLSAISGVVGLFLAIIGLDLLWAFRPPMIPETLSLGIDGSVLAFTLGLVMIAGLVFGLVPALQARKVNLVPALKDDMPLPFEGSRKLSARNVLVIVQVALSLLALLGAGLFLSSLRDAYEIDLGFEPEKLLVMSFDLGPRGYSPAQVETFQRRVLDRAETIPGVESAALAMRAMLDLRATPHFLVTAVGQDQDRGLKIRSNSVSPDYFDTMGVALQQGRSFNANDRQEAPPVVIVNRTMAEHYWPQQSAIGQQIRINGEEQLQVVGVAEDCSYQSIGESGELYMYRPHLQAPMPSMVLHVKTAGDPATMVETVRREVQALDPELPWTERRTMAAVVQDGLWGPSLIAGLFSLFGFLAVAISAIGIYSVMSFVVSNRHREFGIRMALGARRRDVFLLVVQLGLQLAAVGCLIGVLGSLFLPSLVRNLLFGITRSSVWLDGGIVLFMLALAVAATMVAARVIRRIQPARALRAQ